MKIHGFIPFIPQIYGILEIHQQNRYQKRQKAKDKSKENVSGLSFRASS